MVTGLPTGHHWPRMINTVSASPVGWLTPTAGMPGGAPASVWNGGFRPPPDPPPCGGGAPMTGPSCDCPARPEAPAAGLLLVAAGGPDRVPAPAVNRPASQLAATSATAATATAAGRAYRAGHGRAPSGRCRPSRSPRPPLLPPGMASLASPGCDPMVRSAASTASAGDAAPA